MALLPAGGEAAREAAVVRVRKHVRDLAFGGTSVPAGEPGDADHNGLVNDGDYAVWLQQFGAPAPAGSPAAAADLVAASMDEALRLAATWIDPSDDQSDVLRGNHGVVHSRHIAFEQLDSHAILASIERRVRKPPAEEQPTISIEDSDEPPRCVWQGSPNRWRILKEATTIDV